MKSILITITLVTSLHNSCFAQFNFKGAIKDVTRQVRGQVEREIRRQVPTVVRRITNHGPGTIHRPGLPGIGGRPCPQPRPQPLPVPPPATNPHPPIYYPKPPTPHCNIRPLPHPGYETPTCRIQTIPHPGYETPTCRIQPVPEPAVDPNPEPAVELPEVEAGQHVTIDGNHFGPDAGAVAVRIGPMVLEADVLEWSNTQTTAVLPTLPLVEATQATVVVLTAAGEIAESLDVALLPSTSEPVVEEVEPGLPVVAAGQQISLEAADMGTATGRVQLVVAGLTLNADVAAWTEGETTAFLPALKLAEAVPATVQIVSAEGRVVDQIDVMFAPATEVAQQ